MNTGMQFSPQYLSIRTLKTAKVLPVEDLKSWLITSRTVVLNLCVATHRGGLTSSQGHLKPSEK